MLNSKILEELSNKLYQALPKELPRLDKKIQTQFKSILQSALSQLEFVSREEFDVQTKVLARTREKLERLEKKLADIEELLAKENAKKS